MDVTRILIYAASFLIGFLASWSIVRHMRRRRTAVNPQNRRSKANDNFYINSSYVRGILGDRLPAGGGHRGGTQAHRAGAAGSTGNGPGYGAGAGTGARLMDEFSGIDQMIEPVAMEEAGFAVGVVRGVRSFKIDKLGRLTGVTYDQIWRPGENAAECRRAESITFYVDTSDFMRAFYGPSYVPPARPPQPEIAPDKPHPMRDCKHGFYAYYDGSDDYHQKGMVSAVVEGYGETVIGTRGFRSMKARIVALHIPQDVPAHLARLVARNYPDVPILPTFKRMVAEFPPDSAGNEPTPESDADFWTRPA